MANLNFFNGHQNDGAPFQFHTNEYSVYSRSNLTYRDFEVDNTYYGSGDYGTVYNDQG